MGSERKRFCYERKMDFMLNSQIRALFDVNLMLFLAFLVSFTQVIRWHAQVQTHSHNGRDCTTREARKVIANYCREEKRREKVSFRS